MEAALELPRGFSHPQFMRSRILDRYTPLDADGLAGILSERRDWKIVTDTKSDLGASLETLCEVLKRNGLACADRVIPQIYDPEADLETVERLGFRQVIFTIYLLRLEDREIVKIARANPHIVAVTMPPARANERMVRSLSKSGVHVYVHTVNGPAIEGRFRDGIWGVYTDSGCRESAMTGQ
jgi:glycerophosphoryl diester phosphodiesterase